MELERAISIGAETTGALHTQRHDDATAANFHRHRILSHQQEEMTTLMHNAEDIDIGQTRPDLAEGQSCISSQSEDDQISNKSVHGLNQIEDIKEDNNMNSLKDYEIQTNDLPETMLSLESSSNVTVVVSKQSLCTASVKVQAKLDREENKKAFTYEDADSLEKKDGTESLKKVIRTEEHDRCTPCTNSHIIGTSYGRGSPMDWFPRRRTESYLERKIRMLQEVEGMNGTLHETLGGSNPHLSRIEREKLEAQAAAAVAMEAHKAALVEAAWCRILKAARIPCELAEVQLQNAEKKAAEAFDAAAVVGVVMHNKPGGSKQSLEDKTLTANGSQTHIVSASLETAFEVDKEVAGALKVAFSHLTYLPASTITDIFNANDNALDNNSIGFDVVSSENDAKTEGEHQTDSDLKKSTDIIDPHTNCAQIGKHVTKETFCKQKKHPKSPHSKKEPTDEVRIRDELIKLMLERVKLLNEEELVSLAMIVATRGLSAMLKEENKEQELNSRCNSGSLGDILVKHVSRLEAEKSAAAAASKVLVPQDSRKNTTPQTLPDLGSILVKHVSKLEREVQEARKLAKAMQSEDHKNSRGFQEHVESLLGDSRKHGSLFVQHALNSGSEVPVAMELMKSPQREEQTSVCSLERDKLTVAGENTGRLSQPKGLLIKPSMEPDMCLFVDVNNDYDKENRDVNSASNKTYTHATNKVNLDVVNPENINNLENIQKSNSTSTLPFSHAGTVLVKHEMNNATEGVQEANIKHYNEKHEESLDKVLVKHVTRLEKEKMAALTFERESSQSGQKDQYQCESLDKILIKHVSQLEKMKMAAAQEGLHKILKNQPQNDEKIDEGLDKILIQHVSRLERHKLEASPETFQRVRKQHHHDQNNLGSLDKVLVKHISRLEKEKQEASPEEFQRVQREQCHYDENSWESLDKVLVKHISRLEKEKQEASPEEFQRVQREQCHYDENSWESLDKVLVKHISRLEKEKQEATPEAFQRVQREQCHHDENSWESLDKVLVKHISRLEKEKQEAPPEAFQRVQREQHHHHENSWGSLDNVLIKHISRLEKEKQEASPEAFQRVQREQHHHDENSWGSLDKILVKHKSRLEKEKQEASPEAFQRVQREQHRHDENTWGTLDKVLVKHISRLEKEKLTAQGNETSQEHENNSILKRNKNARDQELQHAWRGMSLGNSLRPHFSKLELDKAAWLQAEEEELKRASKH